MHLFLSAALVLSSAANAKKPKKQKRAAPEDAPVEQVEPAPPAPAPAASAPAASVPRIEKQAIGDCGCWVYAPAGMTFEPSQSEDGSDMWTGSVVDRDWEFGVIAVRFANGGFADGEGLEDLAESYLDFLNDQFGIMEAAGYGRGHRMESNPAAKGIIDYWKDSEGHHWAVKAWVDQKKLAVLFVAGPGDYPVFNLQQMFLDGFRFE